MDIRNRLYADMQCPCCGRDYKGDADLAVGDRCPSDDCPGYGEDWYARRDELEPDMVFNSCWGVVKLDHRVPGDGSKWRVASWNPGYTDRTGVTVKGGWCYDEGTIEPGDLTERLPDDYAGEPVAEAV